MYGEYDDITLDKLHRVELSMLKDINELCDKHNIKYFVISGTAIGAVRHQGFIPWDDDIDIAMLRPEYEKFIKVVQEEYSDKYEMSGPGFSKYNYNLLVSFVNKNTLFVNDAAWAAGMNPGVAIDIFIYDRIPELMQDAMPLIKACKKYAVLYQAGRVNFLKLISAQKSLTNKLKFLASGLIGIVIRTIPGEVERISAKYCKAITSYAEQTGYCSSNGEISQKNEDAHQTCGSKGNHYTALCDPGASYMDIYDEDILPYIKMPFEDTYVWMINKYDKQIRQHMGDSYMQLPPEDKRTNHYPRKINLG